MKGKAGLLIGLAAGYVLGTRAGRERYEQIKTEAAKVWELDPVQAQVAKVQAFGASAAKALPGALWTGAKRVTHAAAETGTPKERAQRAGAAAKSSAKTVADVVEESVDDAKKATPADVAASDAKPSSNGSAASGS
ncbi:MULTISPECIES: hypothetical protein [unclassified Microbacterium]|uniref:hypothetical protein n=1 Tax=unclassified Microbacterium TaxID=2609290 RepID=UPI003745CBEF